MLIKVSNVRKIIHNRHMSVKPEALEILSRQIEYMVKIACARATEDRRKRIDTQDFIIQAVIDIKNKWGIS